MDDAVARYRTGSEAADIDAVMEVIADDVEVVSPISGRMVFRGRDDVRHLLDCVYGTVKDLCWTDEVGDGGRRVLYGEMRVAGLRMTDAMLIDLGTDGRIRRVSPHLRPWLGLTVFAALLGPKVARKRGIVRRALS
jgi:SnoaL-like protein